MGMDLEMGEKATLGGWGVGKPCGEDWRMREWRVEER